MNKRLFKAALARAGYTQAQLARELEMAESTLTRKIKHNSFTLAEAERIVEILHITDPCDIFFAKKSLDK